MQSLKGNGQKTQNLNNYNSANQSVISRQALWVKNRVKQLADDQSSFRDMDNSFNSNLSKSILRSGNIINDKESMNSSYFSGYGKQLSTNLSGSSRNQQMKLKSSFVSNISRNRSSRHSKDDCKKVRVQVISDFDSQNESFDDIDRNELENINKNIGELEKQELIKKRETNVYDQVGLQNKENALQIKLDQIIKTEETERNGKVPEALGQASRKSVFSEMINVYINKTLKEALLVIYNGIVYLLQKDHESKFTNLIVKPCHFLDDVSKIIYSERHETYLAFRLRDLKKNQGRDHIILEIKNRELLADYMIQYAEDSEDEIIFEQNEEFSILISFQPIWFSFDDVDKCK